MAITIPDQIRSVDPYADHRFSNTINRFNRIFTGGEDTILPFDDNEFNLSLLTSTDSTTYSGTVYSWVANKAVKVGPGMCIKDDMLIHIKDYSVVNFADPTNYVGSGTGYNSFDTTGKYFILLSYTYARSIPAPQASIVVAKQRNEFLNNRDRYIYLGTATVGYTSTFVITEVELTDTDENNGNALIERPNYEFVVPFVDGGDLD